VSAPPDPYAEIRLTGIAALRGPSFWSRRPVVRMEVAIGAYEEIHSADVPDFTDRLIRALPGLWEHRCSVGERGGFVTRLRRGTYAAHVAEHVALELQGMIGHDVGFGRARGGERTGEYVVVLEHRHTGVGMRAAALALEVVRRAFAGVLEGVDAELAELRALAETPDLPPLEGRVLCGVTGGGDRAAVGRELARLGVGGEAPVVEVAPEYLLAAGLPYARSEVAVILSGAVPGVHSRYAESEMAARLLSVIADGVPRGGCVVVPAEEREVQERVRDAGRRAVPFTGGAAGAAAAAAEALSEHQVERK
jgi:hypothetical protein